MIDGLHVDGDLGEDHLPKGLQLQSILTLFSLIFQVVDLKSLKALLVLITNGKNVKFIVNQSSI